MMEISATEFVKNFGQYKERVQREVIAVTSHGRTSGYFLSEHEYMLLSEYSKQDSLSVEDKANLTPQQAAAHIRESRKGNALPKGVTIEDLINEGRA
ncbi:MAG: hypothetical protein WCL30_06060 [Pseudomonadota bacterium]